jgi:transcriptional regulator with XRE-family HTH domain
MPERFPQGIYLAIAAKIKERRKSLSITQAQLAKSINLDRTAISRIENGGRHLEDAVDLFLIAEKLDIPLNYFFPDELKSFIDRKPKYPNIQIALIFFLK